MARTISPRNPLDADHIATNIEILIANGIKRLSDCSDSQRPTLILLERGLSATDPDHYTGSVHHALTAESPITRNIIQYVRASR